MRFHLNLFQGSVAISLCSLTIALGCAISVIDSSISEDVESGYLIGSRPISARTLFTPEHDKVSLRVQFNNNLSGSSQVFRVDWISPDGEVYLSQGAKTIWGRNDHLVVELPIRDHEPSRMLGRWTVKLHLKERLLITHRFSILDELPGDQPLPGGLAEQTQLLEALPGAEVERRGDSLLVRVPSDLLFAPNSPALDASTHNLLDSLAHTLSSFPEHQVVVKGHVDRSNSASVRQQLSEDRADQVRDFLVLKGVAAERITAIGLGARLPLAADDTEAGRARNRRIEIEIHP